MPTAQPRFDPKILCLLSAGHLVTDLYQGALPALLPLLRAKLGLTYAAAGAILLAANLSSSVVQPVFGILSDRKEKPLLLPAGCLVAGVGFSLLALPASYAAVLALVLVSGLGIASYHPEGYKTASYFTGARPTVGMSLFSVGGNLGLALGPILCLSIIGRFGLDALPLMALPALAFTGVVVAQWRRVAVPREVASPSAAGAGAGDGAWGALGVLVATVVLRSWTQMGLMTYIPFYHIDHLGGDPVWAGKLVSAFLLGGVVGTLGGAPLADRWGHKRYLVASLGVASLLFPLIPVARGVALAGVLAVFGMVLISTFTVTVVMAQQLLPSRRGVASGMMVGFAIGTGGIGATLLGVVADRFGVPAALQSVGVLPVAALLVSLWVRYPRPAAATERSPT
ncbi:MAG: MFS transporter [Deferrisomatales bacterium]